MLKTRIKYLELDNQCIKGQLSQHLNKSQNTSTPASSYGSGQSPFLKFYQHNFQLEKQNDNNESTILNDTSSIESSNNDLSKIESASSPQQQAAAIALISLHSPPSLSSTPKKQNNCNKSNSSSKSTSSSSSPSFVNHFIKCEQTTS
jgi:hypothetical protein